MEGGKSGGDNRWSRTFKNASERARNAPKNAADKVKNGVSNKIDNAKQGVRNGIDNATRPVKNAAVFDKEFAKAKGVKAKAGLVANKFKGSETYKKLKELILKVQQIAAQIAAYAYPLVIIAAILIVGATATIFIISVAQSVSPTPHYYCDTEADSSLRKTTVYQQYCTNGDNFDLENLNGHYIVQDGSGPCADCATANMFMRYYTTKGLNFFDYLWDDTGMYKNDGQTLSSSLSTSPVTIRKAVNGSNNNSTACTSTVGLAHGARQFASEHGVTGWTMANWCYLRDESLDLATYEQTDDYYLSNADNDKWVFDLSVPNKGIGSTWCGCWSQVLQVSDINAIEVTAEGSSVTGETIKDLLSDGNVCGDAGILLYYNYPKDGSTSNHAILITKYDEDTGYWYAIDSAKGLSGGYEGPLDGSGNFGIHDTDIAALLDSGEHANGEYSINRICYISDVF
jgi:hypothetical protein